LPRRQIGKIGAGDDGRLAGIRAFLRVDQLDGDEAVGLVEGEAAQKGAFDHGKLGGHGGDAEPEDQHGECAESRLAPQRAQPEPQVVQKIFEEVNGGR